MRRSDTKHSSEEFNSRQRRRDVSARDPLSVIFSFFTFCHLYPLASYVSRAAGCPRSIRECNFRAVEESSPMGPGTSDTDTIHLIKLRGYSPATFELGTNIATLFRTLFDLSLDRSICLVVPEICLRIPEEHFIEIILWGRGSCSAANLERLRLGACMI